MERAIQLEMQQENINIFMPHMFMKSRANCEGKQQMRFNKTFDCLWGVGAGERPGARGDGSSGVREEWVDL